MSLGNNSEFGFGQKSENRFNCPSPVISSSQQFENYSETTMTAESLFFAGWDSLISSDSNHQTNQSSYDALTLESQRISDISHLVQCPSGAGFNKLDQRLSCLESGSYVDTMAPLGGCKEANHEATNQEESLPISKDEIPGQSINAKKRKMKPEGSTVDSRSQFDSTQGVNVEEQKDISLAGKEGLKEKDDKKHKSEQSSVARAQKVTTKQAKDLSQNSDSSKDGYIHVRARRGQATNSHSLAERVRREKISERMKFLQDLVPGCNKITGKAVMLDEIINYVQSLQRQVEFLSMKLATVNPELNFDIERILSKDILHSQGGGSSIFGFCQGMTASHPHLNGFQQRTMQSDNSIHNIQNSANLLKATNMQFCSLPQVRSVWDNELQSVVQMGFVSNAPPDILDMHGQMK
ncbi:hypothetical protein MRB53_012515 [Persea americana]|uniref:Uncharacterized protein n=1 Tax=Persea americana TaxID=3435 RepID=A0ACC2LYG0_PERAE|nr:hypothetical protein MRB53_012515 [Persea americana]